LGEKIKWIWWDCSWHPCLNMKRPLLFALWFPISITVPHSIISKYVLMYYFASSKSLDTAKSHSMCFLAEHI
jgi:acyl-CoA thioesterase